MEISLINNVQTILAQAGKPVIDLPMIVAVGDQSSGKSSVIERLIGKEILPKGSGIVTRRPLIIQMCFKSTLNDSFEFAHKPGKIYYSSNEVMDEISAETNRVCGTSKKNISSIPISLKVLSAKVIDLTIVDLPGLTRIAVAGQDESIVQSIHDMVLSFIKKETSLILAVSPANQDIANSSALKLAKLVDSPGLRTIGVITKIDLMDEGTDCLDILQNKSYKLKKGFIGLVNRNQKQISSGMSYDLSIANEQHFFENSAIYEKVKATSGTEYLRKFLQTELISHIKNHIYSITKDFSKDLIQTRKEISLTRLQISNEQLQTKESNIMKTLSKSIQMISYGLDIRNSNSIFMEDRSVELNHSLVAALDQIMHSMSEFMIQTIIPNAEELSKKILLAKTSLQGLNFGIPKSISKQLLVKTDDIISRYHKDILKNFMRAIESSSEIISNQSVKQIYHKLLVEKLKKCYEKSQKICKTASEVYRNGLSAHSEQDITNAGKSITPRPYDDFNQAPRTFELHVYSQSKLKKCKLTLSYQSFQVQKSGKDTSYNKGLYFLHTSPVHPGSKIQLDGKFPLLVYNFDFKKFPSGKEFVAFKCENLKERDALIENFISYGFLDRTKNIHNYINEFETSSTYSLMLIKENQVNVQKTVEYIFTCYNIIRKEVENMTFCMSRIVYKSFICDMYTYVTTELATQVLSESKNIHFDTQNSIQDLNKKLESLSGNESILSKVIDQLRSMN